MPIASKLQGFPWQKDKKQGIHNSLGAIPINVTHNNVVNKLRLDQLMSDQLHRKVRGMRGVSVMVPEDTGAQRYWRTQSASSQPTLSKAVQSLDALLTSILQACCASVLRNSLLLRRQTRRRSKMRRLLVR